MIEIRGLDELLLKLDRLGKLEAVPPILRAAAEYLLGKLAKPPEQAHVNRMAVYGETFQSDRQRRFFFAALRDGEIEVPYHRGEAATSERLESSWTISEEDGGLTQVLGNDTSYGPFVMGNEEQSLFMQYVDWRTTDEIANEAEDTIVENVTEAIQAECDA